MRGLKEALIARNLAHRFWIILDHDRQVMMSGIRTVHSRILRYMEDGQETIPVVSFPYEDGRDRHEASREQWVRPAARAQFFH